ncbi:hypothetical protein BDQ94DRAFT_177074 [Aspergillus welwitschiae]|uniref:GPI ethanolamine phosphate transferase 2 C-terminal domain-containing protein n=1 Tax=Aspergillus welwitschiae TaxID=1341132 RepID=A0A3F3QKT2_9EURO|nr:hypothetical protein BDQ94DRAFT_177074 [Aspergillus welwitschiae]RDH39735.1 hypothetical protein BDQ94DRAFT_177074 [Aspergillus welwitschiae]
MQSILQRGRSFFTPTPSATPQDSPKDSPKPEEDNDAAPSADTLFPKTDPAVDGEECLHDCASCTVKYPAKFDVDQEDNMYGNINGWSTHVLVATGKSDWVRDVADEEGSVMEAIEKGGLVPSNGKLKLSASNMPVPDEYHYHDAGKQPTTVLLLPRFTIVDHVTPQLAPDLIKYFVNRSPTTTTPLGGAVSESAATGNNNEDEQQQQQPSIEEQQEEENIDIHTLTSLRSRPSPHSAVILLCSHRTRDARCGQSAPLLRKEFERHLRHLGLYRDMDDERPGGVGIYFINHVGGHKYAANVIIYRRRDFEWYKKTEEGAGETEEEGAAQGIWLARVRPQDCENIVSFFHTTGLYLFTKGFLLTRQTLDSRSNCSHPPIPITNTSTTCWTTPTFTKAIILLIDALRYDFTIPATSSNETYHNALTILHTTALHTPHNALLYPFIADPPTTTLQRLKALTTGTLPTFIEAGSNFAGSAITEDNLISQLHDAGKRLVLLGDDTWVKLFPGQFDTGLSRPYSSFLVEDLHTVDDGVYEHLLPLLRSRHTKGNEEWDVIIAHFLGVDHVGHRFGPGHPEMRDKLVQMDGIIREVIGDIDDETLLVVMGDHGMDENGNHGGETADEVRAALWMYTTREVWGFVDGDAAATGVVGRDTPQVDLVPTLALLMGVPVPFNNLGRPIEEVFAGREGRDWGRLVEVNALVVAQIQRFTREYERYGGEGVVEWDRWDEVDVDFGDELALREYYQRLRRYQGRMLEGYKRIWAQFDPLRMIEGLVVLLLGVVSLLCFQVSESWPDLEQRSGMVAGTVTGIVAVAGHVALADTGRGSVLDGVILGAALGSIVWNMWQTDLSVVQCLPGGVWGWQTVMFTLLLGIGFASNSYTIWEDRVVLLFLSTFGLCTLGTSGRLHQAKGIRETSFSVIFTLLSRVASLSRACREEQLPFCRTSFYRLESSSIWQLSSPVITAVAVVYITRMALQDHTARNLFWFGLGIPSALLLDTVFNILETASNNGWLVDFLSDDTSKTVRMTVARMVLAIVFIGLATAFTTTPRHRSLERPLIFTTAVVLAGILSSTPAGGLSLAILYYQLISLRHLVPNNSSIKPTIAALLGTLHFFSTGHNATLSSIQWKSAYIPFRDTQYPWSPLLVIINTFAAPIVAACAVPLLHSGEKQSQARFLATHSTVYTAWAAFTALWACILRRHLMLFAIFCPRFMMAGGLLVIVDVLALINSVLLATKPGITIREKTHINSSI